MRAELSTTGQLLKVTLSSGGSGYSGLAVQPAVRILRPKADQFRTLVIPLIDP